MIKRVPFNITNILYALAGHVAFQQLRHLNPAAFRCGTGRQLHIGQVGDLPRRHFTIGGETGLGLRRPPRGVGILLQLICPF